VVSEGIHSRPAKSWSEVHRGATEYEDADEGEEEDEGD
jgi:hypothetical protein